MNSAFCSTVAIFACAVSLASPAFVHELLADRIPSTAPATNDGLRKAADHGCPHGDLVGRGRMVYLRNCRSCHGTCGDGKSEYAPVLRTKPRDLTAGVYKWRSTPTGALPTDEDLTRTLSRGVPESGMPAFADMPERDRLAVIAYIKSLAPRFTDEPPGQPLTIPPEPAMTIESVTRGALAYERAGCALCHGAAGNGRGPLAPDLVDDNGDAIRPADLTGSAWKGGCQDQELYRSIMTGLDGTPMPSFDKQLSPDEAWALVHYILSLDQR